MQTIKLNLIPGSVLPVVNVSQYDDGRQFALQVYEGSSPYSLTSKTVEIRGTKPDKHGFAYDASDGVVSVSGSTVTITTTQQMTACGGQVIAELRIKSGSTIIGTINFIIACEPSALSDDTDTSDTDIPVIERYLEGIVADCEVQALIAEGYAVGKQHGTSVGSGSPYYHNNAAYYNTQAGTSATNASNSATAASNSATSASNNALKSEGYAVGKQNGSAVGSGSPYYHNNADYYSTQASSSASSASNSALAASADSLEAEGWSVGTQNGAPVGSGSPYYHNNAKYYASQGAPTALGSLSDVDLSTPTNGQVLKYDSAASKWINGNAGAGDVTWQDLQDAEVVEGVNLIDYLHPYRTVGMALSGDTWVNTLAIPGESLRFRFMYGPNDSSSGPLVEEAITTPGVYEYTVTIPAEAYSLNMGFGTANRIYIPWEGAAGTYKFKINITGVDVTTVGGFSFKDVMLSAASGNYVPYYKPLKISKLDKLTQRVNGAYNALQCNAVSADISSGGSSYVTYTVNEDGTISAFGGAFATNDVYLEYSPPAAPYGTYKFVGCPKYVPTGDVSIDVLVKYSDGSTETKTDTGNGFIINDGTVTRVRLKYSQDASGRVIYMPMLTPDLDATYWDYAPYSMTNKELTEDHWGKSAQKVAGAYNLLPQNYVSQVINNVTYTVNADKSITADGTAQTGSWSMFPIVGTGTELSNAVPLSVDIVPGKTYQINAGYTKVEGGVKARLDVYFIDSSNQLIEAFYMRFINTTPIGLQSITVPSGTTKWLVILQFLTGYQVNNITVKPMLTPDLSATLDDYVPHCMSNRELTDTDILSLVSYAASGFYSYGNAIRYGRIVSINGIWEKSDGTGVSKPTFITGLPAAWAPRENKQGTGVIIKTDESVAFDMPSMHTDGSIVVTATSALVTRGNFSIVYTL